MSIHSNVQSYNKEPDISHLNHAQDPPQPRSAQPAQPMGGPSQYLWVATYIDGQYYLTDPQSMAKLKNIEAELEQERQRLAQLEHDNLSQNDSFLSLQD